MAGGLLLLLSTSGVSIVRRRWLVEAVSVAACWVLGMYGLGITGGSGGEWPGARNVPCWGLAGVGGIECAVLFRRTRREARVSSLSLIRKVFGVGFPQGDIVWGRGSFGSVVAVANFELTPTAAWSGFRGPRSGLSPAGG